METFRQLSEAMAKINRNRERWAEHDTAESALQMVQRESAEAIQQLNESYVTGDVTGLALELADIMISLIKVQELTGIDLVQATEMKMELIAQRYSDHSMSNGQNYEDAIKRQKTIWKAMGGDEAYTHALLDYMAAQPDSDPQETVIYQSDDSHK